MNAGLHFICLCSGWNTLTGSSLPLELQTTQLGSSVSTTTLAHPRKTRMVPAWLSGLICGSLFWHRCPTSAEICGGASLALEELVVQGKAIEMVQGEEWEEGEEW